MALVTIRILDGPERGKTFRQMTTPVSVGREEGNFIQLNDERVSRYHLKIHENEGVILLTDLQSTNGTRVNGETIHVWRLRPGDVITVGRSVMVFGSTEEISRRLATLAESDRHSGGVPMGVDSDGFRVLGGVENGVLAKHARKKGAFDKKSGRPGVAELSAIVGGLKPEDWASLHLLAPPELPRGLSPQQAALLSEFFQYMLLRLRAVVDSARMESRVESQAADKNDEKNDARVVLPADQWQNLLDMYARIAGLLNSVSEP